MSTEQIGARMIKTIVISLVMKSDGERYLEVVNMGDEGMHVHYINDGNQIDEVLDILA